MPRIVFNLFLLFENEWGGQSDKNWKEMEMDVW